jgi:outer membrane protein with beta-barrel domain
VKSGPRPRLVPSVSWARCALSFLLLAIVSAYDAAAQSLNPGPPGPFVFDARGVVSGIPNSEAFVPPEVTVATIPARGFGGSVGGHLYAIRLGPGRFGIGVDLTFARGTSTDVQTTLSTLDPQVSYNFGTSDGWSYLSAGVGAARVKSEPSGISESVQVFNWGGGARWFLSQHFGIGFDIRIRHLSAGDVVAKGTSVAAAVGLSLK